MSIKVTISPGTAPLAGCCFSLHKKMTKVNRRKKKKEKKRSWDAEFQRLSKEYTHNGEGYSDPTMAAALRNLIRKGY